MTHLNTLFLSLKTQNGACLLLSPAMGWRPSALRAGLGLHGCELHKPLWAPIMGCFLSYIFHLSALSSLLKDAQGPG